MVVRSQGSWLPTGRGYFQSAFNSCKRDAAGYFQAELSSCVCGDPNRVFLSRLWDISSHVCGQQNMYLSQTIVFS